MIEEVSSFATFQSEDFVNMFRRYSRMNPTIAAIASALFFTSQALCMHPRSTLETFGSSSEMNTQANPRFDKTRV
jgi:hypothetical protein